MLGPWVIGSRMMAAMTDLSKGRVDHRELSRMWSEKAAAFVESCTAANLALARLGTAAPFSSQSAKAATDLAHAMTASSRRRVVANAKRLSRRTKR